MATQTIDMIDTDVVTFIDNGEIKDVDTLKLDDKVIWEKYGHIILQTKRNKNAKTQNIRFTISSKKSGNFKYKIDDGDFVSNSISESISQNIEIVGAGDTIHRLEIIGDFNNITSYNDVPDQTTGNFYPTTKVLNYGFQELELGKGLLYSDASETLIDTDIIIPSNVVAIENQYIYGDHTSYNFIILGNVLDMTIHGQTGFNFKNTETINNINVSNGVAISFISGTTSLVFDGNIKYIANGFGTVVSGGSNVTDVTINEGVVKLGDEAFFDYSNSNFTTIVIPSSVNYIGNRCFQNSVITTATFNQPQNMTVRLPRGGGNSLVVYGMFYNKTARNMTVNTDNYDIANYDYNADNVTATILHLDGTSWNKTSVPTLSLNGDILTISGSNADKYFINAGSALDLFETTQNTVNLKEAFPSLSSGTNYTISVTGVKTDISYCRSDTASTSYTPS